MSMPKFDYYYCLNEWNHLIFFDLFLDLLLKSSLLITIGFLLLIILFILLLPLSI